MCIGAIDGKHILIKKPNLSGSTFYNYKHHFSIQLLAVVDHDYKFVYIDVGCQGRVGDAGVFQNSQLYKALETNSLDIPPAQAIGATDIVVPYVFVGDEAFPLRHYLMKPYAHRGQNVNERIFNYRLSRARRIVENAFGILAARFRIFRGPIEVQPNRAKTVVLAAVVLHNFLRVRNQIGSCAAASSTTCTAADEPTSTEQPHGLKSMRPCLQKPTLNAKVVRNTFTEYFMQEGQVSWQWNLI